MSTELELLVGFALSALLGTFGQGLRVVAGLKKQNDEAAETKQSLGQVFDRTRFWTSLFIGAMAGVACYFGLKYGASDTLDFTKGPTVLGIIAAGYAGADFIEAFAKKHLPK